MQAIQTALQLLLEPGDEVILPSPGWPNFPGPMRMMGARPVFVPMQYQDRHLVAGPGPDGGRDHRLAPKPSA
jgi:aspartate/methionine/tyrosine aminotransferase